MAGGIIQLVAQGIQDLYLTGDPQITYFKIVYRRHTNFATEFVIQNFSKKANFGETVSCTISKVGDLVNKIVLYTEVPAIPKFINETTGLEDTNRKFAWVRNLGHALIQDVSISIDDKIIDRQYGEWLHLWSNVSNTQPDAMDRMIGNLPQIYEFTNGKPGYELYVPLQFWFCRVTGLSLPLIALSSSSVKINVNFRRLEECCRVGATNSIEIMENICPFNPGDYIKQTIDGRTIYGRVISYDYLTQKLYYIKIYSPLSLKKTFTSYQSPRQYHYQDDIDPFESEYFKDIAKKNTYDDPENFVNIPYRIYGIDNKNYVTPRQNQKETQEYIGFQSRPQIVNSYLYVEFVYLDSMERAKFIASILEYLIEQVQFNQEAGVGSSNTSMKLSFRHPCKSMYWFAQLDGTTGPGTINETFNYENSFAPGQKTGLIESSDLLVNGKSRFGPGEWQYFNLLHPMNHHSNGPSVGINVYSFSLYPELHQPCSTLNASKIETMILNLKLDPMVNPETTVKLKCYTINYNVMKIGFGMVGLAFE